MSFRAFATSRIRPVALRHPRVAAAVAQDIRQARAIATGMAAPIIESPQLEDGPCPVPTTQPSPSSRRDLLKDARPFSDFLTDNFHRQHDYLRISLTERCNLRCVYCMPEEGVPLSPQRELLTSSEIVMLSSVFVSQGVNKIRLTGGEPTIRRDILPLMQQIGALRSHGLRELCLTTNGLALHRKLEGMVEAGLTGVNLSLDTLDPFQFQIMTRRKGFDAVMKSIDKVLELNKHGAGIKLKINCVVMRGLNDREILPFVEMTREQDIEVRFIEYMPFDGNKWNQGKMFSYSEMLDLIREKYPGLSKVRDQKNDTSKTWKVPGFVGRIGFITSMTHNFCGTCNRLRITSDGNLKVCLFGNAEVSLRDILRQSNGGEPIDEEAYEAMKKIEMDRRQGLSDHSTSVAPNEKELLDVIGMAVKRKKEKHAGIGELEHMKNRPMILIAGFTRGLSLVERCDCTRDNTNMGYLSGCELNGEVADTARSALSSSLRSLRYGSSRSSLTASTAPRQILPHLFSTPTRSSYGQQLRLYSSKGTPLKKDIDHAKLTHISETGSAHMVSISDKVPTKRVATAICRIVFTDATAVRLIRENQMKKGDVLGVARVAGIMAAKRTPDLIPLCHPIAISKVAVEFSVNEFPGESCSIGIEATVACEGKTGVEMEALTAASTAALTIYDMCKAVDKGMCIEGLRVVLKEGGKSGRWVDGVQDTTTNI